MPLHGMWGLMAGRDTQLLTQMEAAMECMMRLIQVMFPPLISPSPRFSSSAVHSHYDLGSGVNQNCAFSDIRHLWSDYSYCSNPGVDCWTWVGQGGDTYIVDQVSLHHASCN